MLTIYGGWPTRSARVIWLLEEMGVPYTFRAVDLRNRMNDAEFVALNPAGFRPVLTDGSVTLLESVATMQYVVEKYGPTEFAPASSDPAWPLYLQFLHLGEASLAAYLNVVVMSAFLAPPDEKDNWGKNASIRAFFNRLQLVSRQLERTPYLAGERFTAADISVAYALELGERVGIGDRFDAKIVDYLSRLRSREGYAKALAKSPPPNRG